MNEKVINEFTVRVSKARNHLNDVSGYCETLKNEIEKLKQELEKADEEKLSTENLKLKLKYLSNKVSNEEETKRRKQEEEELKQLKELKKNLEKEKDKATKEHERLRRELSQKTNERLQLEKTAQNYSEKLEQIALERKDLEMQNAKNQELIHEYSADISSLKEELEKMKRLITHTFEEELKSSPSKYGSSKYNS